MSAAVPGAGKLKEAVASLMLLRVMLRVRRPVLRRLPLLPASAADGLPTLAMAARASALPGRRWQLLPVTLLTILTLTLAWPLASVAAEAGAEALCACPEAAAAASEAARPAGAAAGRAAALPTDAPTAAASAAPSARLATAPAVGTALDPAPITLVTPFVAGSGPDHVAHAIAQQWSLLIGQPVRVLNMPENQGRTAARWVAASATDERLVLLTSARMLDAGPPAPRGQRLRRELAPPLPLENFHLVSRVGLLPFVTVLPKGMLPGALNARPTLTRGEDTGPVEAQALQTLERADDLSGNPVDPVAWPQPPQQYQQSGGQPRLPAEALPPPPRRPAVFPPLFSHPGSLPGNDWNGLLVSARMPDQALHRLKGRFEAILATPEVRWALAQAGTDLWEEIPPERPAKAVPLPVRSTGGGAPATEGRRAPVPGALKR